MGGSRRCAVIATSPAIAYLRIPVFVYADLVAIFARGSQWMNLYQRWATGK